MIKAISPQLGPSSLPVSDPPTSSSSESPSIPHRLFQKSLLNAPSSSPPTASKAVPKEKIANNFGQSAQIYEAQAHLQRQCASQILSFLDKACGRQGQDLPPGPILEIGCGTGFITQYLIDRFLSMPLSQGHPPTHPLHITDLSIEMVEFCQHHLKHPHSHTPPLSFHVLDAETSPAPAHTYSLIIGGFVAQWFKHLTNTVEQLIDQLKPGGRLVLSFPGHQSFPEWRRWCDRLLLPYTAHPLPNPHALIQQLQLLPDQYDLRVEMCPTYYENAKAFFKSMKVIGAGATDADQRLSPKQMRRLLKAWQPLAVDQRKSATSHSLTVHYEVVYLSILKR